MQVEQIGDATLYLGDSIEVIDSLTIDVMVTDPPYGVKYLVPKSATHRSKGKIESDTIEGLGEKVLPIINRTLAKVKRAAVCSGNKYVCSYPQPGDIGGWFFPRGSVRSSWGFNRFNLVLFYGKDPHPGTPCTTVFKGLLDDDKHAGHPTPKPLIVWTWLVERASLEDEIVLDPF